VKTISAFHTSTVRFSLFVAAWLCTTVLAADNYVIFEDDFDSDSDGPLALCMLLELEAAGECKIIACGTCELHEDSTAAMAATLNYFGRGDIPLGSYRDDRHTTKSRWLTSPPPQTYTNVTHFCLTCKR